MLSLKLREGKYYILFPKLYVTFGPISLFSVRYTGSATLSMAYVAKGALDCFQMDNLKAWDVAAGILLVCEAGGSIMDTKGTIINLLLLYVTDVHRANVWEQCVTLWPKQTRAAIWHCALSTLPSMVGFPRGKNGDVEKGIPAETLPRVTNKSLFKYHFTSLSRNVLFLFSGPIRSYEAEHNCGSNRNAGHGIETINSRHWPENTAEEIDEDVIIFLIAFLKNEQQVIVYHKYCIN